MIRIEFLCNTFNWHQARSYQHQRGIPLIAHQRLVPVSVAPSSYSRRALYSDALYSEAMEPIVMIAPPRPYNPARYFDETLSSSLQVFKSL